MNRKRESNVTWAGKEIGTYPNVYIACDGQSELRLSYNPTGAQLMETWIMDRRLARIFAKRINQCLDDTK